MPTNVDERIVAAKFDASDFEKGVDKTIKKLDDLKKSLNLKDATKGVEELAEKTEASTNSMSKSLEKLTERFTTFTGMIKQKILSGLAEEVSNVFLKMERSVTGFIRSISSDQVSAGMSKYEQMLTSVRIMMSAGESEGAAYEAIGQLRDYSDQTSYSLSQMTDALSKLRAAGVDLDTATRSVEGIANACANAGINATDAQRAFFNLSQAYSSGVLKYTDYRSLELLNMTTADFKNQILEAAVAAGTLKKTSEGVYQTINKNNKKVTAGKKVTAKNLQDMLRYNFVTSDVMNELFGGKFFFDEKKFKEYKKKYKDLDAAIAAAKKDYGETAVNAYLAAREARSFTDVINTLKDVVSTGWSTTFEHLFGKLEQAKDFFTKLAEGELADVVYKIGEYRNAILGFWNNGVDGTGGGEVFRQTILNVTDALGVFLKTFLQILPGFDELNNEEEEGTPILQNLGDKMFMLSMRIRDASTRIKEAANNFNNFMNTPIMEDGPTRIELIRQVLSNLASVFTIVGKVVSIAFQSISKAFYTLSPIFDGFLQIFAKVTEPLVTLKDNTEVFDDMEHSVNNVLIILEPIAKVLGTILGFLGDVGAFFAQMAIDTVTMNITFFADALGLLLELFGVKSSQLKEGEGVLDGIRKDFEGIKEACRTGLDAVKSFFGALLGDIKRLLGLSDEAEEKANGEEGGIFSGLTNFFKTNEFVQQAKAWVEKAIVDVGDFIKSIPERVMKFGANIYDTLRGLFFKDVTTHSGTAQTPETKSILTPLGEWVVKAADDIKNWFADLPNKIVKAVGDVGNWINGVFDYWFGKKENYAIDTERGGSYKYELPSNFEKFITDAVDTIKEWFSDLPNKIQKAFKSVGDFASNLIKAIDEFLFGKKNTRNVTAIDKNGNKRFKTITTRYKTGFSKWLDEVIKNIKKFIKDIPTYIKSAIKGAGDIVSTILSAIFGKEEGEQVDSATIEKELEKPFLGINISNILNTIADIGKEILNQIARIFTGSDDVDFNTQWFADRVAEAIEWIRTKSGAALNWVLDFFRNLPTTISNLFKGENKEDQESGPIGKAISDFGVTIGGFIASIPGTVADFFTDAIKELGGWWDRLYNSIIGNTEDISDAVAEEVSDSGIDAISGAAPIAQKSKWDEFVEKLGKLISTAFTELPRWVAEGIHIAVIGVQKAIGGITDWLKGVNIEEEAKKVTEQANKEIAEGTKEGSEKSADAVQEEENPLWTAIKNIGLSIYDMITKTIPALIKEAWTWISDKATDVWDGIKTVFTGEKPKNAASQAVHDFGTIIYNFITKELPSAIQNAFNWVSDTVGKLFGGSDKYETDLSGLSDAETAYVERYIDSFRKAEKRIQEKNPEKSFIEKMKDGLLNAFQNIGPAILNGISTALNWIGDVATYVIDAITGKKSVAEVVEDKSKEENPKLKQAFINIGEALRKFFLETIPYFIGSAIGALAKEAPKWFEKLFGAINQASEDESKKSLEGGGGAKSFGDAVQGATGVLDIVKNIFNELKTWVGENKDFLEIIGVIVALTLLFSRLSDLFSLSDDFEEGAKAIKWTAITIAIAAIAGIMSYITQLVNSGGTEKIEKFESIIDKIGNLMLAIAGILGMNAIGKLFDALGEKWDNGEPSKLNFGESLLGSITDAFGSFLTTLGIGTAGNIVAGMTTTTIAQSMETLGAAFQILGSELDSTLEMIDPFVENLASMNDKLENAVSAAGKLKSLFETFYGAFDALFGDAQRHYEERRESTDLKELSIDEFFDNLFNRVELYNRLSAFISTLADAIAKFSNVPDVDSEMDKMIGVLTTSKFSDFLTKMLNLLRDSFNASKVSAKELGVAEYLVPKYTSGVAVGLEILSSALSVFANGIAGFDANTVDAFDKTLDVFQKLSDAFDKTEGSTGWVAKYVKGDSSLSAIGTEIKLFGSSVKSFYDSMSNLKGFGDDEVELTKRKVSGAIDLAKEIAKAMQDIEGYTNSFTLINNLSTNLPTFATSVGEYFVKLDEAFQSKNGDGLSADRVEMLVNATEGMALMMHSINEMTNMLRSNAASDLNSVMDSHFSWLKNSVNIDRIASLISAFDKALIKVMETEDFSDTYKGIGQNVAAKLSEGIQSAFDDPNEGLQPTITPILKLDTAKQQLIDFFGIGSVDGFNLSEIVRGAMGINSQTEEDRVKQTWLNEKLDEISGAISDGPKNALTASELTTAFTEMKIVIYPDTLAGELTDYIDERIGAKIADILRGVSVGTG